MSDQNQNQEEEANAGEEAFDKGPTRLESLKLKAAALGIKHSGNIGEETLAEKIREFEAANTVDPLKKTEEMLANRPAPQPLQQAQEVTRTIEPRVRAAAPAEAINPKAPRVSDLPPLAEMLQMDKYDIMAYPANLQTRIIRAVQRHEQLKLIRCQIYNNNPAKLDLKGEILAVSNKYVGVVKKFVPFGEATEKGYHVPFILLEMMRRKKYQCVYTVKNDNGTERVVQTLAPEYTINVLPQLTPDELHELAMRQAAAERVSA
jgi:hypothetical protein